MHLLNIVQRTMPPSAAGVTKTSLMRISDLNSLNDPLSMNAANANKAATSIPSMFARMLFFQTAFENIINPTNTQSVYAKFASDCLDLMEDLFNHNDDITIVEWNKQAQLATLHNNPVLHDALSTQLDKFLGNVTQIFLFVKNGQVIGGTSPFSVVYTSPNWHNNRPVVMLQDRTPKFREFLYRFADAYNGISDLNAFINFINRSKPFDHQYRNTVFAGLWPINTLVGKYPALQYGNNQDIIIESVHVGGGITSLYLHGYDQRQFSSDMFIDSNIQTFSQSTTPLLLPDNGLPLSYYDGTIYPGLPNGYTKVEAPNNDIQARNLPGCNLSHSYITSIDLLEDYLIKVPYKINEQRWSGAFNIDDKTGCMLPVKPMLFKYFTTDKVKGMLKVDPDKDNKKVTVTLNVPVRDDTGNHHNIIPITKVYKFDAIQKYDGMTEGYTVGVSPFYEGANKYYVVSGENNPQDNNKLELYSVGTNTAHPVQAQKIDGTKLRLYSVAGTFDYIRIIWGTKKGVVIPKMVGVTNQAGSNYTYGVDFGTTNTHIAFTRDGKRAESFNTADYKWNVEFLSSGGETGDQEILTDLARTFFPDNASENYSFPIRTVVSTRGVLNGNSQLFEHASIGFRYSKEYTQQTMYQSNLKWKFDNTPADAVINAQMRCFCEETMLMIKNHWNSMDDTNHANPPKVAFTYPAAMANKRNFIDEWTKAYINVFGNPVNITDITESLAPCRTEIAKGTGAANGLLNIDIGGGTTDIQYYREENQSVTSYYNSVKFAGDDLWGKCYENVNANIGGDVDHNKFKHFANDRLGVATIKLDANQTINIDNLTIRDPKEYVGLLLKDQNDSFARELSRADNNECRRIMFLHYAAIMRYVMVWLKDNGVTELPHTISFTGLGSKYLSLLFDDSNRFKFFSRKLMEVFSGMSAGNVDIELPGANPKNITAEGACLYAAGGSIPNCTNKYSLGCSSTGVSGNVTYNNVRELRENLMNDLNDFINKFNSIEDCDGQLLPQQVIYIDDNVKNSFLNNAGNSFDNMANFASVGLNNLNTQVKEAIFFWALKDSLWKLD